MSAVVKRFATLVTFGLALGGCGLVGSGGSESDVLMLVQSAAQDAVMQALYVGKVVQQGECLRLERPVEGHTVVWPHGFSLGGRRRDFVMDDRGRPVGRIGESFRLGGGEVPTLWEGGPVSESDRRHALSRCPGRYWLVGEIG